MNGIIKLLLFVLRRIADLLYPPVPQEPEVGDSADLIEHEGGAVRLAMSVKAEPMTQGPSPDPVLVVLDPGHGPATKGKQSPPFDDGSRFKEYEFNWDIANRVAVLNDEGQHLIRYTHLEWQRRYPDTPMGNSLAFRVKAANEWMKQHQEQYGPNAKVFFISIHSNAAPTPAPDTWADPSIRGVEVWYHHYSEPSLALAKLCHEVLVAQVVPAMKTKDRGLKSTPDIRRTFYVLKHTKMPATLLELGFYNNPVEVQMLMNSETRDVIAKSIFNIIKKLNNHD